MSNECVCVCVLQAALSLSVSLSHTHILSLSHTHSLIHTGTPAFKKIVHLKPRLTLKVLQLGYQLLLSDADVVLLTNPFHRADVVSTPLNIMSDAHFGYGMGGTPHFVNSGFVYMKPTHETVSCVCVLCVLWCVLCVCVYVCMCVCVCICICMYMYVYVYAHFGYGMGGTPHFVNSGFVYMKPTYETVSCVCVLCVLWCVYVCMCVCVYVCVYVYVCTCMCM